MKSLQSFNVDIYNPLNTTEMLSYYDRFGELMDEMYKYKNLLERQIKELLQSQVVLEESRKCYHELYEFAPINYFCLNEAGFIVSANRAGAKSLGIEREKLINQNFTKFIAEEYHDQWHRVWLQIKQTCKIHSCELSMCKNEDTFFYAHVDYLYHGKANESSSIHIVFTDITERKVVEKELNIAALTFETNQGIMVTDTNKVIIRTNKAFSHITGYDAKEAIGHDPSFLQSKQHDMVFYKDLWATIERDGFWQGEIWNKRKNGEVFPLWQTITAVRGVDNRITHYIGIFTDITNKKHSEKQLLDAKACLEIQVATSKEELECIKNETVVMDAALNIMTKRRTLAKTEAQVTITKEVESTILPTLSKLKRASSGRVHSINLISILEFNVKQLLTSFGRSANLTAAYRDLTRAETKVAKLIEQGLTTKTIASILNVSPGTVEIHRKNIRKKFGLQRKRANLYRYLQNANDMDAH